MVAKTYARCIGQPDNLFFRRNQPAPEGDLLHWTYHRSASVRRTRLPDSNHKGDGVHLKNVDTRVLKL